MIFLNSKIELFNLPLERRLSKCLLMKSFDSDSECMEFEVNDVKKQLNKSLIPSFVVSVLDPSVSEDSVVEFDDLSDLIEMWAE